MCTDLRCGSRIGALRAWWVSAWVCLCLVAPQAMAQCHTRSSAAAGPELSTAARPPLCPEHPELPPEPEYYDAAFDSQNVPTTMVVGQRYTVGITMRNTGSAVWNPAQGYRLGSQNPHDNHTWGIARVDSAGHIGNGQRAKFTFTVTAPRVPGHYNFRWGMLREGVAWFGTSTPNVQVNVLRSDIVGHIDGVSQNRVFGWACSTGIHASIDVHLYLRGAAGAAGAVFAGSYRADRATEAGVGTLCGTHGTAHRFDIPVRGEWTVQHADQPVYVHGISPVGAGNPAVRMSGNYRIPANLPPVISMTSPAVGAVYGEGATVVLAAQAHDPDDSVAAVTFLANGKALGSSGVPYQHIHTNLAEGAHTMHAYARDTRGTIVHTAGRTIHGSRVIGDVRVAIGTIEGWACATHVAAPIAVQLYLGGAAGAGVQYGSYTANIASEGVVNTHCKGGGTAHGFSIPITDAMVRDHGGKRIHVHGISPVGGANNLIANSGNYALPINQPPSIALVSPGDIREDSPAVFTLRATASDPDDAVAQVAFFQNGQPLAVSSAAPWQHTLRDVPVGTYRYHAVATDRRGATATSSTFTVTVVQAQSPRSVTRRYVYDGHQRLCKTIEPETGATVVAYDAAGNVAWSAAGLDLPDAGRCDHAAAEASGRVVRRSYDARNRPATLVFPDGNGNTRYAYTPDGLLAQASVLNDAGTTTAINSYQYNRRRLLTSERVVQPGGYDGVIVYGYDGHGHRSRQSWPTGTVVQLAPNALGQPTRVGNVATGVRYHPNGAVKQFTYGNGVVHSMQQNARQLPERAVDSGVLGHFTAYDAVGNVVTIRDLVLGAHFDRHLSYDGLNRLTAAGSGSFGGNAWHQFTYDALDNLRSWQLPGVKDHQYWYDARNRLTNVRDSHGNTTMGLSHDVQGNLAVRNGLPHVFDFGNRLRSVADKEHYRYDAQGRRIVATAASGTLLSQYTQDGRLVFQQDHRAGGVMHEYLHLGNRLIARRDVGGARPGITYLHTDALGSPVASSNAAGQVVERTHHEPYGAAIGKVVDGPGYTGHVMDGLAGLVQMQQRYYDPETGRFLSVDPVTAYANGDWRHFSRYAYAYNNPYKFTDPDGRVAQFVWGAVIGAGVEVFVQTAIQGKSFSQIDVSDVLIGAGAGALTGGIASASALAAAKGTVTVGRAVAQTAAGSGAVGVNASLAGDVVNGKSPDVGGALVEGAAAAALGAAGQRLTLGPTAAVESLSNKGGLGAHIAETTRSANIGSDAAKVASATSAAGSNTGQALTAAGTAAKAKIEEKLK